MHTNAATICIRIAITLIYTCIVRNEFNSSLFMYKCLYQNVFCLSWWNYQQNVTRIIFFSCFLLFLYISYTFAFPTFFVRSNFIPTKLVEIFELWNKKNVKRNYEGIKNEFLILYFLNAHIFYSYVTILDCLKRYW